MAADLTSKSSKNVLIICNNFERYYVTCLYRPIRSISLITRTLLLLRYIFLYCIVLSVSNAPLLQNTQIRLFRPMIVTKPGNQIIEYPRMSQ